MEKSPADHVRVSTSQLCVWGGAGTHQGYVKHMTKYHSDGKAGAGITNGRKKAQLALMQAERITCRESKAHER